MRRNQALISSLAAALLVPLAVAGAGLGVASATSPDCAAAPQPAVDLSSCDLSGADFHGADLTAADLRNADLSDADLTGAVLVGARLMGADLTDANLSDADMHGLEILATLDGADLSGANLAGVWLRSTSASAADFTGANLTGATIEGVGFDGVDLTGVTLTGVYSANVNGTPAALPSGWVLQKGHLIGPGAVVNQTDLTDADLRGANLTGTDLHRANLTRVNFTDVDLSGSILNAAYINNATLIRSDLHGLDLSHAVLQSSDLTDADLAGANLTSAFMAGNTLTGADLSNTVLYRVASGQIVGAPTALPASWSIRKGYLVGPGADLRYADLVGADLSGAPMNGALLTDANLTGANLTGANLTGADLTRAALTGASWSGTVCPNGKVNTGTYPCGYPVAAGPASLSARPHVGASVTCRAPAFAATGVVTYSWAANGVTVSGAAGSSLKPTPSMLGKSLRCTVTTKNSIGTGTATSPPSTVALGAPLRATKAPAISGTHKLGKTLTCKHGTWSPSASGYKYQWYRSGKAIKGATSVHHKVVKADRSRSLTCKVTARATGYAAGSRTSAHVKIPKH